MRFTHDTERILVETAALVNTLTDGDTLRTQEDLDDHLERYVYSGVVLRTPAELRSVRALRPRLRAVWDVRDDRDAAAALVNEILAESASQPYLARHDQWDWHLHVTRPDAPLVKRMAAEAAMAFLDLIRADELDRLRTCGADDCEAVLVDLSRNRSRRFCDTGCGNRLNVAAYRARKRGAAG